MISGASQADIGVLVRYYVLLNFQLDLISSPIPHTGFFYFLSNLVSFPGDICSEGGI